MWRRGIPALGYSFPRLRKLAIPLEIRVEMYDQTQRLRKKRLSYSKIRELFSEKYGFAPSKSVLSEWLRKIHHPLGSAHNFVTKPTPELAYVIGVKLGDGSINRRRYNYRIRLQSVDREFVEEFDRCASSVLRSKRHTLWKDSRRQEIHVEIGSVLLYSFLRQSLGDLRTWAEHCDMCVSAFLRGFFDSEGSISPTGELTASNNDTSLLGYVRGLLYEHFRIETTGLHLGKRRGSKLERRGKSYVRNSDTYHIYIRSKSIKRFARRIGFTIRRKQARLESRLDSLGRVSP